MEATILTLAKKMDELVSTGLFMSSLLLFPVSLVRLSSFRVSGGSFLPPPPSKQAKVASTRTRINTITVLSS